MKKLMQKMGAIALTLLFLSPALADNLLMARVNQPFPEAVVESPIMVWRKSVSPLGE